MSGYRPERVAEQIHKEVALLMMHGIKDPRVAPVSITGVTVSKDLSIAKVFFTVLDEATERKDAERGLKSVAPYLRRQLGQVIRMRFIPELRFEYDKSIGYGRKIDDLLRQVQDDLKDDDTDDSADS
ncbi:ribosome-binding factor A [Malonomonas rubra DSM 5091]|uniref:Ribosome-binding factor A n=1 Tax=Malonomonas rubra DSM 5091 TaxID=1122189 RepID=A0A1M6KGW0_MALRU|nr:30S ribosome-binding factor RbfA [Malonomonas rubra]SHJ58204.1 ribosome-binding factor A [Malonomonas rubra DSM 5091]